MWIKNIKYLSIVGVAFLLLIWYGQVRYKHGVNAERAIALKNIASLTEALHTSNIKAIQVSEQQKKTYNTAIEKRNNEIYDTQKELRIKELYIKRLLDESENICINELIPDNFK